MRGSKKRKKKAERQMRTKESPVQIPLDSDEGVESESKLVEFTDVPEGIQHRVEAILRDKGLIPAR